MPAVSSVLYANSQDGRVFQSNSNWATARDNTTGSSYSSTEHYNSTGIRADATASRGGGTSYNIQRIFMYFDTSDIKTQVNSATLNIYGFSNDGGDIIAVKSNSYITSLGVSAYDAIDGWDTSTGADGSGAGSQLGNVTRYSNEFTTWNTSAYNQISLRGEALNDMRTQNVLYVCLMNYDYDLLDIAPTGYTDNRNGLWFTDEENVDQDPKLVYTLDENSVHFGANF